jgi:hypothetical protein
MANIQKGFVHTVFFWLHNLESSEDKALLKAGLDELAQIDLIQTAFVGSPAGTSREVIDSSYAFSITFIFETREQQDAYQTHPDHLLFIDKCSHLWKRVIVYDAIS